eukprot:5588504-Pyramimonas_sp.AAC.1
MCFGFSPFSSFRHSKLTQRQPGLPQNGPKTAPRRSKKRPQWLQGGPTRVNTNRQVELRSQEGRKGLPKRSPNFSRCKTH